jgi:hypothetical protein
MAHRAKLVHQVKKEKLQLYQGVGHFLKKETLVLVEILEGTAYEEQMD